MIYIKKGTEPVSLRLHRNTPGADFDGLDKTELRNSLLEEQGYLCAYCMKRIRKRRDTKIEHYEARNQENQLLYENLLAVCTGDDASETESGKVNPAKFTCDSMKKNQKLSIDPQSKNDMNTIYYDNQGRIYSTVKEYQEDLDQRLNLNDKNGYLISNRSAALQPILKKLKMLKEGQSAEPLLRKLYKYCSSKNQEGELPEYVGIQRWYIERKLKRFRK